MESRTKSERFLKQQNFQNISQKNIFLKYGKERFLKHDTKALKIKQKINWATIKLGNFVIKRQLSQ